MVETQAAGPEAPLLEPPGRLLIVQAPYYAAIAEGQLAGAKAALDAARAGYDIIEIPGALEIAPAIRLAADTGRYEGYVALGCVIRGETTHYETVCQESARGLTMLGIGAAGPPLAIGNGILTCETLAQAEERSDPSRQDKGAGAAIAALHLIALARRFGAPAPAAPPGGDTEGTLRYAGAAGLSRTA